MTDDRSTLRAPAQDQDIVVYDGRGPVGFIRKFTDIYVAYDAGGRLLGRFRSRHEALRALPIRARRAAP
jgi:hypothetical protein